MQRMSRLALRRWLLQAALWIPVGLVVVWFGNQERLEYRRARAQVQAQARRLAVLEGQRMELRLLQAMAGADPTAPDTASLPARLRAFALRHPELLAPAPAAGWRVRIRPADASSGGPREVREPLMGLPLMVSVGWPQLKVRDLYGRDLVWRLPARSALLALFVLGAVLIGRLLRSREALLAQSARLARLRTVQAHVNQAILRATEVPELLREVCRIAVSEPAIALAWIARPDTTGRFHALAAQGEPLGYLEGLAIATDPALPGGQGSAAAAWHEGRAEFTALSATTPTSRPWRERLQRFGLHAAASVPLRRAGRVWALLQLYSTEPGTFDPDMRHAVQELAADVSKGLDRLDVLRAQAQLQRQRASVLDNSVAGIALVRHPGAVVVEANAAIARIFGAPDLRSVIGMTVGDAAPVMAQDAMVAAAQQVLKQGRVHLEALDIVRLDGKPASISVSGRRMDSDVEGCTDVVWTVVDVTEHQRLLRQLERLSQADPLTGLPNRRALDFHLERSVARAVRMGTALAVGLIDLDDFKPVNDRWGHEIGDALLRQLGERLRALARASDMVARLGGDEFVLVIEDLEPDHAEQQLAGILARVHEAVERPFQLGAGRSATLGMSMGVALGPADGASADALLRLADAAMYRIKVRKAARTQWWARAGSGPDDEVPEPAFDPFSTEAQTLLERVAPLVERVEQEFAEGFFAEIASHGEQAAILASFGEQRLRRLKTSLAQHLRSMLEASATAVRIQTRARHLGMVHALVGVAPSWLSASMQFYRDLLHWHLDAAELSARQRNRLQRILGARIQIDLQAQLDAMLEVQNAYSAYLARPLTRTAADPRGIAPSKLRALAGLPGIVGCAMLRPGAQGLFELVACEGGRAAELARSLTAPGLQMALDFNQPTGMGMAALAWRSDSIMTARSLEAEPGLATWRDSARALGIHSVAAIPLMRAGQTDAVMVLYGAYPNQFDTVQGRTFVTAVQNRWNLIDDLMRRGLPSIDPHDAALVRQWLYADGLRMFVQPIVDLRDGRLVKVEALARLASPEGEILSPAHFLAALREADLDSLFRLGLVQSLQWLSTWHAQGLELDLSLNLPPSTMLNPQCAVWIEDALRTHAIAARHLTLELLESQEVDESVRDEAVATLRRVGVRLAIDDLGSGFSSLKRLASMPFDVVKVDRGILLDIDRDPVKALSLMRTVVQIGRDFEKEVVVEGIETAAVQEAATLLGARYGQGFGIARPMPASEFAAWARDDARRETLDAATSPIRTPLGALAFHWLCMHEEQPHREASIANCPLSEFLAGQGEEASEAVAWHAQVHAARDAEERRAAGDRVTAWLVEQVRAAAGLR
ncbi:MAG: EAL domain-containing protein [Betaproteobacteria bacterium]|nr:EAL domain-containing protein [Betaproteobacteria bacterium]